MGFELEFSSEADIEFNTIDCFLGTVGTNVKFHKDFHFQMLHIKANPLQFQTRYKDVRITHLKRFNYSIHFRVVHNIVTVLRILHQHQSY